MALLALTLGLAACEDEAPSPGAAAAPPPPEVTVASVAPAEVPLTFEYAGRVAGFREVEVRPQVGGILMERSYEEGARVEAGQLLFRIDRRPYEVALARAQAQLRQAQAQLRQAEDDYARQEQLYRRQVTSERQRDEALAQRDLARAAVAAAEAEIAAARLNLDFTEVNAPIAGVTSLQSPPVGTLVQAQQTLLTTITRLDPAYVNFSFTDAEYAAFRALNERRATPITAEDLTLELRFGDGSVYPHPGRIDTAAQSVDPQTGTIQARAIFPNPEGVMLPGQFVRVVVRGVSLQDAITVPKQAVSQGPQGPFVYVLGEDGRASARPIRLGRELATAWVVPEGLAAGDRVVTEGVIRVRPGAPVRIAEAPPAEPVAAAAIDVPTGAPR
jgi:membrane fusion protein (multidrug efflux system)